MFNHIKIFILGLVFTAAVTPLGANVAEPSKEIDTLVVSPSGSSAVTEVKNPNYKLKLFTALVKNLFAQYKQDAVAVEAKLDLVGSDCSIYIINSCDRNQFFELSRFKLKNKGLFSKLGFIALNIFSEVALKTLESLDFSKDEIGEVQSMMDEIDITPDDVATKTVLAPAKSKEYRENMGQIVQKFNLVLDRVLGHHLGVNSDVLSSIKQKLEDDAINTLSYEEVKELHRFVTKKGGAFDKIVKKIDSVWAILLNGLN